jgi:hypothetical protein
MRTILILSIILLLCPQGRAQSGNASLAGTWNIQKVELRQTVDGIVTNRTFAPGDAAATQSATQRPRKVSHTDGMITDFSIVRRPVRITFAGDNITLEYAGESETGTCRFESGRIHVDFQTHPCEYTYSFAGDGELRLSYAVDYMINDETMHIAKDECTFYGRK